MVPGGGLFGIWGVVSGNAALLTEELPDIKAHVPVTVELPRGVIGAMVPIVLPVIGAEVVADGPNGIAVVLVLAVGATVVPSATMVPGATIDPGGKIVPPRRIVPGGTTVPSATIVPGGAVKAEAPLVLDVGLAVTGADEVVCVENDDVVCTDTGEQLTLVPGAVGSSASGTGARVVAGAPGCVTAENGLGPVRGDDTIAPGVEGIPMDVVPMVEICAMQALPPSSNAAIAPRKDCIEPAPAITLK
jgi:hypothetical protein